MHADNRCPECKKSPIHPPYSRPKSAPKVGQCSRCDAYICEHTADPQHGITSYGNGFCRGVAGCEHRQNIGRR